MTVQREEEGNWLLTPVSHDGYKMCHQIQNHCRSQDLCESQGIPDNNNNNNNNVNALSAHMMHINLNMIFYTHAKLFT